MCAVQSFISGPMIVKGTIKNRLQVYERLTAPVAAYYSKKGKLLHISADDEADKVIEGILQFLNKKQPKPNKAISKIKYQISK